MKKIILSAAAVLIFSFANAQEVKFGAKVGMNIANQKFEGSGVTLTANSIVGVQVGGFGEVKVNDKFAIQPEVLFSTEGSELKSEGEEVTFNLSYINVPVMVKFYPAPKFNIQAGPQVGLLVAAKGKYQGVKEDIKDGYKTANFGLNLGAAYEFTKKCFVDARYNFGLSNIMDNTEEGVKNKGAVLSFAVGYKF